MTMAVQRRAVISRTRTRSGGRVVSQGTMLELLLPSRVRRKVLALFLINPEERLHIREIERRTEEDFQGVRRELNRLERAGLLRSKRVSNLKFYSLNKEFYLYPELRSIIIKSERAGEGIFR